MYRGGAMKHYITLDIVSDGEIFSIQADIPPLFNLSIGPMSMQSALVSTVNGMLAQLCAEIWRASQPTGQQATTKPNNTEEVHNDEG